MFAGAAREAVFSRPEVIARVKKDFIPVVIRAQHVQQALSGRRTGAEFDLFKGLGQSRAAPQGIAVLNADGQVLDWVLSFETEDKILGFFDESRDRYRAAPRSKAGLQARRFRVYPGSTLPPAPSAPAAPPTDHPAGELCPGDLRYPAGSMVADIYGRSLDKKGAPVEDTLRQENYSQDRFAIAEAIQKQAAEALASLKPGDEKELPRPAARALVSKAYLGTLDVQILDNPSGATSEVKALSFQGRLLSDRGGTRRYALSGQSDLEAFLGRDRPQSLGSDGRLFSHHLRLKWSGFLEVKGRAWTRLVLKGEGEEELSWSSGAMPGSGGEVARLPAGRRIDRSGPVRYGLIGYPVKPKDREEPRRRPASRPSSRPKPQGGAPRLEDLLGPRAAIFKAETQTELGLDKSRRSRLKARREELEAKLRDLPARLKRGPASRRPLLLQQERRELLAGLEGFLAALLSADERRSLARLELRLEGAFALLRPEIQRELKLDQAQGQALRQELRRLQQSVQEKQARASSPASFRDEVRELKAATEKRLLALLTEPQRAAWKAKLADK